MNEGNRIWIARDGERYEAHLRRTGGRTGTLTFTRLDDGRVWAVSVGASVSLIGLDTAQMEAWLRVAQGRG